MPVNCSTSVLTGQDGSVWLTPAGTSVCLRDNTDFPAGTEVTLPSCHGFMVGDEIEFVQEDGGVLDTGITAAIAVADNVSGPFVITGIETGTPRSFSFATVAAPDTEITLNGDGGQGAPAGGVVSAIDVAGILPTTSGNYTGGTGTNIATTSTSAEGDGLTVDVTVTGDEVTAIVINAGGTRYVAGDIITIDGGDIGGTSGLDDLVFPVTTASALTGGDTALPAHINVRIADHQVVCQVANFSLSLTRDEIETTSLPCTIGGEAGCLAPFKTKQSGFADGTGTLEVNFTADQTSLANRLIADSLKKNQNGASVRLFINTVSGAAAGEVDLNQSLYIEAPIVILGFSIDVSPEEATTAELSFAFAGQPTQLFGTL